jgi:hypothetical protein
MPPKYTLPTKPPPGSLPGPSASSSHSSAGKAATPGGRAATLDAARLAATPTWRTGRPALIYALDARCRSALVALQPSRRRR